MLAILQEGSTSFVELIVLMLFWSKFSLKEENNWFKNSFIIVVESIIMILVRDATIYTNVFISYASLIIIIKFTYNRPLVRTTFEFIVFSSINMFLQILIISAAILVGFPYSDKYIWAMTLLLIELILTIVVLRLNFSEKIRRMLKLESTMLYYFTINLGIYVLFTKVVWEYNKNIILNNLLLYIFIILLMLFLNIFLYYYIVKICEDKKVLEVQNMYKPILLDIVEETRRKQHDFKNYLNTINAIVEITSETQIKNELKKYIMSLKNSNNIIEDIMYIDNIIIKAIIFNKSCEADRTNIKFIFNVTNNSLENSLNDYEISDLLNNLLDNAFQAVISENKEKVVILNICEEENTNMVEVKNSGITIKPDNIENIFERGFSTKKGNNRGYGLYNINEIARKKGSDVELSFEDNYTVFKICF